jgi:hypothetical protein
VFGLARADNVLTGLMLNPRIDITEGLDGEPVVLACFDLGAEELAASAQAVNATIGERFRTADLSTDDVLELRELTALADELTEFAREPGMRAIVMRPARLSAWRDALAHFVESRDDADWARADDREALPAARSLLWPLEDLCAEAMRAALSPPQPCGPGRNYGA